MTFHFRQAIITKEHPCNADGDSRISAKAQAGTVYVWWNSNLTREQNHTAAALKLCKHYDWRGTLAAGALVSGLGYCFSFVTPESTITIGD